MRGFLGTQWQKVSGIGVVMPGSFAVEGISSTGPTTLNGLEQVDIEAELATINGLLVTLQNDATVAAIGEGFHGTARHLNSFIYLYIGTGLGAGIFTDGHIYIGHANNAGETGQIVVKQRGRYLFDIRLKIGIIGSNIAALGGVALPIFDELNPQFQVLMK